MTDFFEIDMSNINKDNILKYEPIPAGVYELAAEESEPRYSKNNVQYIAVKYRVLGPTYENWVIWENFVIGAKNNEFAKLRLYMWGQATGIDINSDKWNKRSLDQLNGEPFKAKVGIVRSREYGDKNKIIQFVIPEESETPEDSNTDSMSDDFDYDDTVPF